MWVKLTCIFALYRKFDSVSLENSAYFQKKKRKTFIAAFHFNTLSCKF